MRRLLALVLLVLPLTACGGNDVTSLDAVAQAAEKTSNVAGAHFFMSARIAGGGETVEFSGPGEIADHGRTLHMKLTMPAEILGMKGLSGDRVTFEAIGSGRYFYFRGGPFTQLANGKWVRVSDDDPTFDLGQNDPSQMLEYLRATSKIEERGSEQVRGVETTRYEARIQLDKIADRVSPEAARALRQMTQRADIKEIPVDVWIDDDGLVRRLKMNWHPQGLSFVLGVDMFDFGDVEIAVPKASQTTDLQTLLGGG